MSNDKIDSLDMAQELFGTDTVDSRKLKSIYRHLCMKHHPDVGGCEEMFKRITDAYKLLRKNCSDDFLKDKVTGVVKKTTDGILLSELGRGYPINESAKTCSCCSGRGYVAREDYVTKESVFSCGSCGGTGVHRLLCKICSGVGKFKNPRNGKFEIECDQCNGSGFFYPKYKMRGTISDAFFVTYIPGTNVRGNVCFSCNGLGGYVMDVAKEAVGIVYDKCWECRGVGEIKMWNPVLPRGFLGGCK